MILIDFHEKILAFVRLPGNHQPNRPLEWHQEKSDFSRNFRILTESALEIRALDQKLFPVRPSRKATTSNSKLATKNKELQRNRKALRIYFIENVGVGKEWIGEILRCASETRRAE